MIGYIAYAEGSPCPTLVLQQDLLPTRDDELREVLADVRKWMIGSGLGSVMKIALIAVSRHPLFDLDYRFVQALPGAGDDFDLRGSCGHSILSAITAASSMGWLPRLSPGGRVRVNVVNNGDNVVCEVDEANRGSSCFTVHFLHQPERRLGDLLLTGSPRTPLVVDGAPITASLVSMGNPYVFVHAADLGVTSKAELFADDPRLFAKLVRIRVAAAHLLGWPASGAFPKVAAIGQYEPERLAVRAVSVPSWHPTLALTGTTCLGAAAAIEGTIPYQLAQRAGGPSGVVTLDTRGGATAVSVASSGTTLDDRIAWVSVDHKLVRHLGSLVIEPLRNFTIKETVGCLALPLPA